MSEDKQLSETKPEHEVIDIDDESMPPEVKQLFSSFMMSMSAEHRVISSADKIADKLTPEHITSIIANSEKDDVRSLDAFKWNKIVGLIVFVVSLMFAAFLLIFFRESEHFATILTALFSFLGGIGFGKYVLKGRE